MQKHRFFFMKKRHVLNPRAPTPNPWHTWTMDPTSRIQYGGADIPFAAQTQYLDGDATGRTIISAILPDRIRQHGYIRRVVANVGNSAGTHNALKFKVFRPVATDHYDFVGESEAVDFHNAGFADITFDLTTPIACQPGDIAGFWIVGDSSQHISTATETGPGLDYVAGDIVSDYPAHSPLANWLIRMQFQGVSPVLVTTGDSIMQGQGQYRGFYGNGGTLGIDGLIDYDPAYQMRLILGTTFEYQNHACGGQVWSWVNSTGIVSALATGARDIVMMSGWNDINTSQPVADMITALDGIKTKFAASSSQRLFVCEILPSTAFNDANAAAVRSRNVLIDSWVTANSEIVGTTKRIYLIRCHDAMGQTRISTGYLDDLYSLYNSGDGIHLSLAGVQKLAQLIVGQI